MGAEKLSWLASVSDTAGENTEAPWRLGCLSRCESGRDRLPNDVYIKSEVSGGPEQLEKRNGVCRQPQPLPAALSLPSSPAACASSPRAASGNAVQGQWVLAPHHVLQSLRHVPNLEPSEPQAPGFQQSSRRTAETSSRSAEPLLR